MVSGLGNNAYIDPRTPEDIAGLDGIIHPMEMQEWFMHVFDAADAQNLRNFSAHNGHRFEDN